MPTDRDNVLAAPCACGSGKPYQDCHQAVPIATSQNGTPLPGKYTAPYPTPFQEEPEGAQTPVERPQGNPAPHEPGHDGNASNVAKAPVTRKLDLASGQSPKDGFEGVDLWSGAQHVINLQDYPWRTRASGATPSACIENESVLELHCSHYIEHIPMCEVFQYMSDDDFANGGKLKDALFAFFDECYRILVPGGWMTVIWPSHRSDRAFQDPTHRRFPTAQTMLYMSEEWRRVNKLDHYNVDCNFGVFCNPTIPEEINLRHQEVANKMINNYWNTTVDWVAKLQKLPRLPPK